MVQVILNISSNQFFIFFSQSPWNRQKLILMMYISRFQTFNKFNDANCTNFFEFQRLLPYGHKLLGVPFFTEFIFMKYIMAILP